MEIRETIWHVAIRNKVLGSILEDRTTPFAVVPNPLFKWVADPFLIEKDGALYIFAEVFSLLRWRGSIGYCIYQHGSFSKWEIITYEAHHFSFPNIFKNSDAYFIMPEANAVKEIPVYQADHFPDQWRKKTLIMNEDRFVDSIWLDAERIMTYRMGTPNQLVLLKQQTDKKWIAVDSKADPDNILRPAGKAFSYQSKWIRPVQESQHFYGEAIHFSELNAFSEESLPVEKNISRLEAWEIQLQNSHIRPIGIHTYNGSEHYEVIDIQEERISPVCLLKRLFMKCRSKLGMNVNPHGRI